VARAIQVSTAVELLAVKKAARVVLVATVLAALVERVAAKVWVAAKDRAAKVVRAAVGVVMVIIDIKAWASALQVRQRAAPVADKISTNVGASIM
jgi:hypothetical protein